MSNKRSCPYKTLNGLDQLSGTSLVIDNITIQGPTSYPTYTLTLPPNDGSPGQILSTNGSGVLSWVNDISGGTVTSVSATVPAWLSVTVTNPTTTPAIAITGTSTGTGTVTVLQDSPTINTLLTVTGQVDITRNSGTGHAMKITNAHAGVQDNYIEIGKNSSNRNHAHFGHHFVSSGDSGNYAYMQTNNNLVKFFGAANFTFPATTGVNGQLLTTDGTGVTSWSNAVTSVGASSPITSTGGTTPTISLTTVPVTLGGTGLTTVGTNGQVLASDGTALQYVTLPTPVTSVTASSPISSSGGATPNLSLSTVPTTLGGTGLTTVGTNGQVLASNGTSLLWQTPVTNPGTVTSVSASVPGLLSVTVSNPTSTPAIAIGYSGTALPTANGGTGLTTVGTNGQVLASNGTILQYVTLPTPVTSVAATTPLASSGGATPTISIASSTGTGAVALQTAPSFINSVTITHPTQAQLTLLAGTVPSLANICDINLNTIGGGGGTISQYIRAAYDATFGYYISINPNGDFLSNGSRNVFPNNMLIGGTSGTSRLNIGDGAMDSALYGSVQITQTDVTNTKASIAFVRNGHFVHGMGYLTGTSTFGFGAASISSFNPAFLSITSSGTIGIGTTTPAYDLDINKPIGSAISFAVRDGFTAGFRTQWNYSGGQGETVFWDYRGAGSGGFWFKNLNTGNTDAGWAQINCGYTVINNNGETLVLEGTDHTYIRFRYNSINRGFLGYSSANTNGLAIVNTMAGGDIYLYTPNEIISDANHKIVGLLKLGNSLSLGPNPSTSAFTFRFPSSMGTSGQVLTTDGTNTYWGSGGGGGTVTSVSASVPAFLSVTVTNPTTTPDIAISGTSTGTGSVVLQTSPTINNLLSITNPSTTFFNSIESYAPNLGTSHSNSIRFGKSSTTGEHGFLRYLQQATAAASSISLGLGSTQIAINGGGQFTIPGGILSTTSWSVSTNVNITSGATLNINNSSTISSNFTNFSVLAPNLQTGVGIQIRLGTASVDNTGITFGWRTNTTTSSRYAYFETASVERLVINTGGNIGIGTSTPAQRLHLVGGRFRISDTVDTVIEMVAGSFTNYLYTSSSSGNLVFDVGNRDHLIYCRKLWVIDNVPGGFEKGTINFTDDNHAIMGRYDNGDSNVGSMNYYAFGEHRFFNNGLIASQTLKMTIGTGGLVGINTATPSYRLHVVDSNPDVTAMMENTVATGYAGIKLKTTTQECNVAVGGAASAVADKFYLFFNSSIRMVMNTSGDFGINTTTPTTKLDVNGSTRSTNFTTNGTQFFTYTEYVVPATNVIMLGSNYVAGTYGYDCVTFTSINPITYNDRYMKVTNIGQRVTITFRCNFSYVADPFPGFPGIVLLVNTSGAIQTRTNTYNTPEMYAQTIMHYPCSITGISNPMAASLFNITYAGSFYVGIFISTAVGTVNYNNTFGQLNQIIQGTITYNIL